MLTFPTDRPFYRAIEHLLDTNRLLLHGRIDDVAAAEMEAVLALLRDRFAREAAGYPGSAPRWDRPAAGWAALILFHAAQLLLYRSHDAEALTDYFPAFERPRTAEAMLSADVCLRYLPAILRQLDAIDVDDELIPILRDILARWPYSGLLVPDLPEPDDLTIITEHDGLARLYADRVIATKNARQAAHPALRPRVLAALGNHKDTFWKGLKLTP